MFYLWKWLPRRVSHFTDLGEELDHVAQSLQYKRVFSIIEIATFLTDKFGLWNFKNTRTKNALNEKKCCTTIKINFEISKTHPVSELYLDPDVDVWVGEQHPGVLLGQGVVEGDVALDLGL